MRINPEYSIPVSMPPPSTLDGEKRLYQFLVQSEKAAKLSDTELVGEVVKYVVDSVGIGSRADVLLMELIARFEKAKGIDGVGDLNQ